MDRNKIEKLVDRGFKGILNSYFSSGRLQVLKKGYLYPFILSVFAIIIIMIAIESSKIFDYLKKINGSILSLLPNLLGFNLGAYTLFVAFGGAEFLSTIVGFREDEKRSLYQKNSTIFAVCLLLQLFTLLFSYIIYLIVELEIQAPNIFIYKLINFSAIFLLILFGTVSIFVLKDIVINIFNLSQMYHFTLWRFKSKSKSSAQDNDGGKENNEEVQ